MKPKFRPNIYGRRSAPRRGEASDGARTRSNTEEKEVDFSQSQSGAESSLDDKELPREDNHHLVTTDPSTSKELVPVDHSTVAGVTKEPSSCSGRGGGGGGGDHNMLLDSQESENANLSGTELPKQSRISHKDNTRQSVAKQNRDGVEISKSGNETESDSAAFKKSAKTRRGSTLTPNSSIRGGVVTTTSPIKGRTLTLSTPIKGRAITLTSSPTKRGTVTLTSTPIKGGTVTPTSTPIKGGTTSPIKGGKVAERKRSRSASVCSDDVAEEIEIGKDSTPKRKRRRTSRDTTPSVCGGEEDGIEEVSPNKKSRSCTPRVREAPNRALMTMQELIYYNPTANPMSSKLEDLKRQDDSSTSQPTSTRNTPIRGETRSPDGKNLTGEKEGGGEDGESEEGRLVPQLRIGQDGNIMIDEASMVVETTAPDRLPGIVDEIVGPGHTTSASYRNSHRVMKWTREETTTFFNALSQVGTDFTMMTLLLPARSRKELKNKFKKEERINAQLISQALKKSSDKNITVVAS